MLSRDYKMKKIYKKVHLDLVIWNFFIFYTIVVRKNKKVASAAKNYDQRYQLTI